MNKPNLFKTAVIIFALSSIYGIIVALPGMMEASGLAGVPPVVIILGAILNSAGLVGAWGAWQGQKWGIWLTIILNAIGLLLTLPGILFAPNNGARAIAITSITISIFVIIVFLRYRPTVAHA